MESPTTLRDAVLWFADFEHCREFMIELRWPDGAVKCPRCGSEKVTWLAKARVWKCYAKHERPTFTLKTGTIFEDSPIPLEKWLCAAWMLFACKKGISSYELHRGLGITQKSAWFMLHRLRLAARETGFNKIGGDGTHCEAMKPSSAEGFRTCIKAASAASKRNTARRVTSLWCWGCWNVTAKYVQQYLPRGTITTSMSIS